MNEKPKRPIETPREWLRYAVENLSVAEREVLSEHPAFHTICFLCQGSAEKFLKGYLISRGWTLERTHDIVELLEFCSDYGTELEYLTAEGAILNEYITAGRYPGDLAFEDIGKVEAEEALKAVRRIRDRVMELMREDQ